MRDNRMSFDEFVNYVTGHIKEHLPPDYQDAVIQVMEVEKPDSSYIGLQIRKQGYNLVPSINLDYHYGNYQKGQPMDRILEDIILFQHHPLQGLKLPKLDSYEDIKDLLFIKVMDADRNKKYLEDIPYKETDGLAVTANIMLNKENRNLNGIVSGPVTKELLQAWGLSVNQLIDAAKENSQKILPAQYASLNEVLEAMRAMMGMIPGIEDPIPVPETPMILLTNEYQIDGAAVMLYPELLRKISSEHDSDLYILPSSKHEVLLIPEKEVLEFSKFEEIVAQINMKELDPKDVLSDSVYHYDAKEDILEKAKTYELRKMLKREEMTKSPGKEKSAPGHTDRELPKKKSVLGRLNEKKAAVAAQAKGNRKNRANELAV